MNSTLESFITEDLYLVAYLTASGLSRLDAIVGGGNTWKKSFRLKPHPSEDDIESYYTGSAQVSALRLCETLRSLKTAIVQKRGTRE